MKPQTFTHFSYNSPIKQNCVDKDGVIASEVIKNVSMTPNIKTNYSHKNAELMSDNRANISEEQQKKQKTVIRRNHNSFYQQEDQLNQASGNVNKTEASYSIKRNIFQEQTQNNNQSNNPDKKFLQNIITMNATATESPFKPYSKKASQQASVSCLPNIFQDQDEYNQMRQQQQAILGGLVIDGKQHQITNQNSINQTNIQDPTSNSQFQLSNNVLIKQKKNRIRSQQRQDSSSILNYENANNRSLINNYKFDRQAKSNEQRYTNIDHIKKAIKASLQKNPGLAASLEIYSKGNDSSYSQMQKIVQPYLMNEFLQKRKNLLQKKSNIQHSTATKRIQNKYLHGRSNNNISFNNNSFTSFHNKSQNQNNNSFNGNQSYIPKYIQNSNNQNINSIMNSNNCQLNNVQNNNIVINDNTLKQQNQNSQQHEIRSASGGQRLLLQDFYNQQGIKDPDFGMMQSLQDQYNYSLPSLNEKSISNKVCKLTSTQQMNPLQETTEKDFEKTSGENRPNDNKDREYLKRKEIQQDEIADNDKSQNSNAENQNNNYNVELIENDVAGQTCSSNMTQSINTHNHQYNINSQAHKISKNNKKQDQCIEEQIVVQNNFDHISSVQKINISSNDNSIGENQNIIQIHNNQYSVTKTNPQNNKTCQSIIDLSYQTNKTIDEASPIKNSRVDKNPLFIQQKIVLQQQQKRKGNSLHNNREFINNISGSGDHLFDLSIINANIHNNININQNNINKFDFYENKQTNVFSPPRVNINKAVYAHNNILNQNEISKVQNPNNFDSNNEDEYTFLNEEQNSDKKITVNPRYYNNPHDQILIIKSQISEQQQQQQQQEYKVNLFQNLKYNEPMNTCYFLRGNNSGLVRRVLLTRCNWKESPVYSSNLNFRWHPFSKGIKFESLSIHKKRIVNHFEFHSEITTKNGIIKNIGRYCSERGLNIFDFTPCTFLFSLKDKCWDQDLVRFCEFFYKNLPEPLKIMNEHKKNVMEIKSKFRSVTIKNTQKQNIKRRQTIQPNDKHGEMKIHTTFLSDNQNSYLWLLKPTNLNRGRGIELFSNLQQLETLLNNYFDGFYEQPITCKVQENNEKQTLQQQQEALLDIAITEAECSLPSITQTNNIQLGYSENVSLLQIGLNNKDKEEVPLKNLFDKSLYQTPNLIENQVEKGKQINEIKTNSTNKSNNNDQPGDEDQNPDEKEQNNQSSSQINQQNILNNYQNSQNNELNGTLTATPPSNPNNQDKILVEDQIQLQQGSPSRNEESEGEGGKLKKQKIKKNKASRSNHNVQNYNNNIHISRVRELSLPKKATTITNQPKLNSPYRNDKKNNKNSNGISAEFGGYLMKEHSFVIQKYIEKPFLINDRKFDIRMWVVVNQNLEVYLFKEGYIRTSSKKYNVDDQDNIFIHLTNNAIQKYSDTYGQYESGNQLSLDNFDEYLKQKGYQQTFRGDIMPRIREIITISMLSVKQKINANERKFSFEIFGYDFFIDQQFNVWLIEINTNPCIEESSPLLGMLIPRMIDDALKLTVDLIFPPQYSDEIIQKQIQKQNEKKSASEIQDKTPQGEDVNNTSNGLFQKRILTDSLFPVTGYSDSENMFQFLVNLYKAN